MTKAKKSDVPQSVLSLMHPDMPFDDTSLEEKKPENKADKDFQAQFAQMQATLKSLEASNESLQRTNMALMGQNLTPTKPNFGPATVDLENLPDPVTDPKAYAEAIVSRGDAVLRARQQEQDWDRGQKASLQERVDGVWDQFSKAYPAYAGKTDLIEAAATKAVSAARAQGIDPNKYMFSATPQFFADTVKTLEGWGIKNEAAEEEQDTTPATRTSGIPGGLESSGKLTQGKDPDEERIPSLMDELKDWKLKTGFYA